MQHKLMSNACARLQADRATSMLLVPDQTDPQPWPMHQPMHTVQMPVLNLVAHNVATASKSAQLSGPSRKQRPTGNMVEELAAREKTGQVSAVDIPVAVCEKEP